jgi:hypothetical protein
MTSIRYSVAPNCVGSFSDAPVFLTPEVGSPDQARMVVTASERSSTITHLLRILRAMARSLPSWEVASLCTAFSPWKVIGSCMLGSMFQPKQRQSVRSWPKSRATIVRPGACDVPLMESIRPVKVVTISSP